MPIIALDPAGESRVRNVGLAPRLSTLDGIRLGVIRNGTGRSLDTARIAELLRERHPDVALVEVDKPNRSHGVPEEMLARLLECEAVIATTAE